MAAQTAKDSPVSAPPRSFTRVPARWAGISMSRTRREILTELCRRSDNTFGISFPAQTTLAEDLGYDRKTVMRTYQWASQQGLIRISDHHQDVVRSLVVQVIGLARDPADENADLHDLFDRHMNRNRREGKPKWDKSDRDRTCPKWDTNLQLNSAEAKPRAEDRQWKASAELRQRTAKRYPSIDVDALALRFAEHARIRNERVWWKWAANAATSNPGDDDPPPKPPAGPSHRQKGACSALRREQATPVPQSGVSAPPRSPDGGPAGLEATLEWAAALGRNRPRVPEPAVVERTPEDHAEVAAIVAQHREETADVDAEMQATLRPGLATRMFAPGPGLEAWDAAIAKFSEPEFVAVRAKLRSSAEAAAEFVEIHDGPMRLRSVPTVRTGQGSRLVYVDADGNEIQPYVPPLRRPDKSLLRNAEHAYDDKPTPPLRNSGDLEHEFKIEPLRNEPVPETAPADPFQHVTRMPTPRRKGADHDRGKRIPNRVVRPAALQRRAAGAVAAKAGGRAAPRRRPAERLRAAGRIRSRQTSRPTGGPALRRRSLRPVADRVSLPDRIDAERPAPRRPAEDSNWRDGRSPRISCSASST